MIARTRVASCARLDDIVDDYVDGALPAAEQLQWDRHLVACQCCRGAVDLHRRMTTTLRGCAPAMPMDLHAMLLSVSQEIPIQQPARRGRTDVPPVPAAPQRLPSMVVMMGPSQQVAVLSPSAPAQHRSALRSAVFATAVAGASVAAVWGIALTPTQPVSRLGPAAATTSDRGGGTDTFARVNIATTVRMVSPAGARTTLGGAESRP